MLNLSSVLAGGGNKAVGVADDDSTLGFLIAITGQVESGQFPNVDKLYCKYVITFADNNEKKRYSKRNAKPFDDESLFVCS